MKARLDKYKNGAAGRHETFVPRYGWLTKGYVKCLKDASIFSGDNSIVELGVGKNMVRSIRFWCLLLGILEPSEKKKKNALKPTKLGKRLFGAWDDEKGEIGWENGWDPYLEDDASLWLLHWQIFIHPEMAVSWPLAFNFSPFQTFTRQEFGKAGDLSNNDFINALGS